MVAFTPLILATTTLLGLTSAAPKHIRSTGVIHRITAGSTALAANGLRFEPENVVAEIGDLIEFSFLPKNHTIVQSSFDKPCAPLAGGNGVFSGFNFATAQGLSNNTFVFEVKSKEPFWYYCSQTVGNHCQMGMSGVINQNFDGDKTLAKYKENSKGTVTVQPSADKLAKQGGEIKPRKDL